MGYRRARTAAGRRSKLEDKIGALIEPLGYKYEALKVPYRKPSTMHNYTPDWSNKDGTKVIEAKGRFTIADRKKMILLKMQYPLTRFLMVFERPENTINKISKTTYTEWCNQTGIECIGFDEFKKGYKKICKSF